MADLDKSRSKEENRKTLVECAECIKEMLKNGQDGFACRQLIELTLIQYGNKYGALTQFTTAFSNLKYYYPPIFNANGLIWALEKFIEEIKAE